MDSVRDSAELRRVLNLPRRAAAVDEPTIDALTDALKTPTGTMRLRAMQAVALLEAMSCGGAFCALGVGEGKTLITLLAAYVLDAQRPLLLLPASLVHKTARERSELAKHWPVSKQTRLMSYEMLGRVQAAKDLEVYKPDLIIADEVHKLKNRRAAVTRRVARYMHDHPETRFVALSGTIMRKSLTEFAHLLRWCLKDRAPVPQTYDETEDWAAALDEDMKQGNELARLEAGALLSFCTPDEVVTATSPLYAARTGFRRRLLETPGFVATTKAAERVDCSIYIRALTYNVAPATDAHFAKLRGQWETPDGYQLSQGTDIWRHANEMALGFHYIQLDAGKYAKWLSDQKESGLITENTEREIKKHFASERGHGARPTRRSYGSPVGSTTPACPPKKRNDGKSINENGIRGIETERRRPSKSMPTPTGNEYERNTENTSCEDSEFLSNNTINSCALRTAYARSAVAQTGQDGASPSTTTIKRDVSEASSAQLVTRRSVSLMTMTADYRQRFSTFAEVARPPADWLDARRAWAAFVRAELSRSRSMDSELQIANAVANGRLQDGGLLTAWQAQRDSFKPTTVAMWHDTSVLQLCLQWLQEGPGVVWVWHSFFGECLSMLSGAEYYGPEGRNAAGEPIEDAAGGVIASLAANKEGRNLQKWSRCLFTVVPDASTFQQAIGRFHRPGQMAEEVKVDVLLGCTEHSAAWRTALDDAAAVEQTTGAESKLLLAEHDWPSDEEIATFRGARWSNEMP